MQLLNLFKEIYDATSVELVFDPRWTSGRTGFDFAVYRDYCPKLNHGSMVRSRSELGQRMLIIGTRFGNVLIYEKFLPGTGIVPVLKVNCTKYFRKGGWVFGDELDIKALEVLCGKRDGLNIGQRIEELRGLLAVKK